MRVAFVIFACLLWGCGPAPVRQSRIESPPNHIQETTAESIPKPVERRRPQVAESCPLFYLPHDVGSVVRISGALMALAMNPAMQALCACSNPGEYATLVARIDYGSGTVKLAALDSAPINECLESVDVSFVPPPASELPGSDCINCGPRYYGVFADSPPPPKEPALKLIYSFIIDRSNEVLDCPDHTHAERGACRSDDPPSPPKPEKRSCGCDASDLKCAIACASQS